MRMYMHMHMHMRVAGIVAIASRHTATARACACACAAEARVKTQPEPALSLPRDVCLPRYGTVPIFWMRRVCDHAGVWFRRGVRVGHGAGTALRTGSMHNRDYWRHGLALGGD